VTYILIDEIKEEYFKRDGGSLIVEKEISVIDAIIDLMFLLEPLVD
jgi:DnaJ-class molecular chaperone